jgi:hypothetical protein
MENVEEIEFELESMCPMKMDKWLDLPQPKNDKGYLEQAKEKCYRNEKGEISVPAVALKAAMRYASSEVGKKMEAKKNRQTISAQLFISPMMLSIGKKKYDEIVRDIASRGTGSKLTRVSVYRPLIREWSVKGKIMTYGVPFDFVKEVLQLAGVRYGLLSHRPEFGRFTVKNIQVINNGKK